MKPLLHRPIVEALFLTAGFTVVMAAQETTRFPPGAGAKVVITGCIERADQVPRAAVRASDPDSLSFVLIDIPESGATPASSATVDPTEARRIYRLDTPVGAMNPHVGHRVELRGTVIESPAAAAGRGIASPGPRVHVEDVRTLSETCGR